MYEHCQIDSIGSDRVVMLYCALCCDWLLPQSQTNHSSIKELLTEILAWSILAARTRIKYSLVVSLVVSYIFVAPGLLE